MKVVPAEIPDVLVLEPRVFTDGRGFFFESWTKRTFASVTGLDVGFVQDNQARSVKGVLRGLHYQLEKAQGKLICVTRGRMYDVAVDIRRSSPTFGRWVGTELSDANHLQVWIPTGFAHGYLVLSEEVDVVYKTSDFYAPETERTIVWNDPDLGIAWPLGSGEQPILSAKDAAAARFRDADLFP